MNLRPLVRGAAASLAFLAVTASAFAAADANVFNLVNRAGRTIGKASYTITKTKDGYKVVTKFQYRAGISNAPVGDGPDPSHPGVGAGVITDNQFNAEYKISEVGDFISGFTQNSADQVMTSFTPNKGRTQVTVGQIQGGVNLGTRDVDVPKPQFLVAPDYDPSEIQVLLTTAAAHPHDDKTYLFLVPAPGSGARSVNTALYVILQPAPDSPAGMLEGKPVTLKHYFLNYHTGKADIYTDDAGTLMEADMGPLGANYVRAKFVLTPAP
jgi:hypothetical protein